MKRFKNWLNESMQTERDSELQSIWADTFNALGVAGLSDEDAAQQSLSKITFNQRNSNQNSPFKGKQAVRKRLENGQIFARLEKSNDPELRKNVENVRKWLDTHSDQESNGSTTVSNLLQMLFGDETFQKLIDSDFPKLDKAKAQVQPMPPKEGMGPSVPAPDNSMDMNSPQPDPSQPPMDMSGQQPQVPPNMMMPQPAHPRPPRPAGGIF